DPYRGLTVQAHDEGQGPPGLPAGLGPAWACPGCVWECLATSPVSGYNARLTRYLFKPFAALWGRRRRLFGRAPFLELNEYCFFSQAPCHGQLEDAWRA